MATTTDRYQKIDDRVGIDYGGFGQWRVALIDENGNILQQRGLGHFSVDTTTRYALCMVELWLKTNPIEALHGHSAQMLLGQEQRRWHSYRLVWGNQDPKDQYAGFSNGEDNKFRLVWAANSTVQVLAEFTLPEGWHELDEFEQQELLENFEVDN